MNRIRWFAVAAGIGVALAAGGAWWGWFDGPEPEPCITDTELMGTMSHGFFISERIQAQRCDGFSFSTGGRGQAVLIDRHGAVVAKFSDEIDALEAHLRQFFHRRFGARGDDERRYREQQTTTLFSGKLKADAEYCGWFAGELDRRLHNDWSYIEAKLRDGMVEARETQPGLVRCGE